MRIKRFAAKSLPLVVAQIKEEFGLAAVILSQRENPETREVEVTAGVREEDLPRGGGAFALPEPPLELPGEPPPPRAPGSAAPQAAPGAAPRAASGAQAAQAAQAPQAASGGSPKAASGGQALGPDSGAQAGQAGLAAPRASGREAGAASGANGNSARAPSGAPSGARAASVGAPAANGGSARAASAGQAAAPGPASLGARPSGASSGGGQAASAASASLGPAPASLSPGVPPRAAPGSVAARGLRPAPLGAARPSGAGISAYRQSREEEEGAAFSAAREIANLKAGVEDGLAELKNMLLDLAHRQSLTEKWRERGDLVRLYRDLMATGLSPGHARDFVEMAAESLEAWGGTLEDNLRQTVRPMIKCLSRDRLPPKLLAAVGPSGAGKTSVVMKLAGSLRQRGRKTALISLDTLKLGAAEQLAQFARIMGLGLKVAQNRAEFREARELFADHDHVLIDTSTRDFFGGAGRTDLTAALAESGAQRLLVLPASLKAEDLGAAYEEAAGPFLFGLALTKLDETVALGSVFNFIRSFGPVFAYFCFGHKAPDDFSEAAPERLTEWWLGGREAPREERK